MKLATMKMEQTTNLKPFSRMQAGRILRRGSLAVLTALLVAHAPAQSLAADFHAYYTRVDSGEPFEKFSRTGDYPDIIVKLGALKGRLVFWRGASYLPYWETAKGKWFLDEIVPRHGDGEGRRFDKVNAFSRVALVESSAKRVLISWRYLPEFKAGNPYREIDPTRFVDEQFEIFPDGTITRLIKQGTVKSDDWSDPLNQTTQVLKLSADGVREVSRKEPRHSRPAKPIAGNPSHGNAVIRPVREWRFDEAMGDQAVESITGEPCEIAGRKSLWRKGVSGTCLQFDDYNTVVSLPAAKAPVNCGSLTLEGWFAIGAYPWNWVPIIQQGDEDGYFIGMDAHAHAGFKLKVGGICQELVATNQLARFRWYHAAGTYDRGSGTMALFLDGERVATRSVGSAGIQTSSEPIQIGKGKPRRPVDPVRENTFITSYAFDGLIDEVRIYDQALKPEQVTASYQKFLPPAGLVQSPDMDRRALPAFDTVGRFGAQYTRLKFHDAWDNLWCVGPHADVVVGFDQSPVKFVFWRGTSYIPMLVNEEDQWYSNEFNETGGRSGGQGSQEPMSDKDALFNHVRVIENTPARVVVHWRYPLVTALDYVNANYNPETGWGDWSDWYYYIYPDGLAVKKMHLWTDQPDSHEWQETMAILGPNQHPEQVLETEPALIMADLDGHATPYSWKKGPPATVDYGNKKILIVNYRARYDPFTIGNFTGGDVYGSELTPYSVFCSWNHWPVARILSDGRYATFPDRASHSSLSHVYLPNFRTGAGERPFEEKLLMEGLSRFSAKELSPLAKSWLQAPAIEMLSDCRNPGYDPSQRAYVLCATGPSPSFRIAASALHPIANLCFVVKNWNCEDVAQLRINSKVERAGPAFRQGIVRDPNGRPALVVWLQQQGTEPASFTLRGAKPQLTAGNPLPMTWAIAPQAVTNTFDVTMAAMPLPGIGSEYVFECLEGNGHSSGWQGEPVYTDSGLSPSSQIAYRVKARDAYFKETAWSPVARVKTAAATAPVK